MCSLEQIKLSVSDFPSFIAFSLRGYLQTHCDNFRAGCVSHSSDAWNRLTSDQEILSTVFGMTIEFDSPPCQHYLPQSVRSVFDAQVIDLEITKLLSKRVIEPTGHSHGEIISDIFLRNKKDGSYRMILNLKKLNQYASKIHFKMDTLSTVIKLIEKDCYMASIDLKDAYYSVSITPADRKYLRFMWQGSLSQFICLPNGLSCAPRKFTKLLKPALSTLHLRGHVSSSYLDDMYLQGKTYRECVDNVIDSVQVVDSLGFVAHPDKSTFIPSQRLEFLGFILNSVEMTIRLTPEKATGLQTACNILLADPSPTIRELARVIGKIVSSFPGVRYGPLYYRSLERNKLTALHANRWNFDKKVTLSPQAVEELEWWANNVIDSYNVLTRESSNYTLTTDASMEGWGALFGTCSTGGLWAAHEARNHINYLELLAAFLGLQVFCHSLNNTHIQLMIDNTTAVAVINHMGTCHSDVLNTLSKRLWLWCVSRNIWISAAHIAGKSNQQADLESVTIDAFSLDWSTLKFCAFPPLSVIPAVLKKIRDDKATGVCVLPNWPTQAWFPLAMKMTICENVNLQANKFLLQLPSRPDATHPLHKQLSLLACLLSGKP